MTRAPEGSHRQRLAAVPAGSFMEVYRDGSAAPEYLPMSLLSAAPAGGFSPYYPDAANQSLSGAGAVNVTSPTTLFTSTGAAQALTLADGTVDGQVKSVSHVVDGGEGVLTPANFEDGTTVTFNAVGDSWTGIWTGSAWRTIGVAGAVIA